MTVYEDEWNVRFPSSGPSILREYSKCNAYKKDKKKKPPRQKSECSAAEKYYIEFEYGSKGSSSQEAHY